MWWWVQLITAEQAGCLLGSRCVSRLKTFKLVRYTALCSVVCQWDEVKIMLNLD